MSAHDTYTSRDGWTDDDERARWAALRNVHRRTPWNMTTRSIEHEIANLGELARLGHGTRGDADRVADLHDELARRYQVGSRIAFRIGNDPEREAIVRARQMDDGKGGGSGCFAVFADRPRGKFSGVWVYDRQITRIVTP